MPLLRPSWARGTLDPEFPAFGELLQCPDAGLTRPAEAVVEAGEVLFVPGGCPHRVENLAESISFAGNFVDDSNLEDVLADQCALAHRYPEAGELHAALDEREAAVEANDSTKSGKDATRPSARRRRQRTRP